MRRREFIAGLGGAAVWPVVARAQQPMPVVGFLATTRSDEFADRAAAFREGLKQAGYIEGQNVVIERRSAEYDQLSALVADLVGRQVALIVGNTPSALATKAATTTVPIIFVTGGDPVRDGLVASVNRSNVTGVSFMTAQLGAKQLGLLHELRPGVGRIAALVDPRWPLTDVLISELRAAASAMGQQLDVLNVISDREIEAAFTTLVQRGVGALHAGVGSFMSSQRDRIVALAARHRIPAIYNWREAVTASGLMSYAPSINAAYHQAGIYAGRILKGEKPGDLPVVLPTEFELVINLKTAKALGLEIPMTLLVRADEVIE